MMMYVELAGGLVILVGAAEVMIRGAVGLARIFGLSPLLIGMTVVALGTSAPELVVSLDAALTGNPGLATGNIVGSNIANVLLITGAAALVAPSGRVSVVPAHEARREPQRPRCPLARTALAPAAAR